MNKIKLTVVALATVGLGAVGISTAFAGSPNSAPKAPAASTAAADTDTDNVQEGDQTTQDGPGAAEAPETGPSDGNDGGHADPEGVDVNHEGGPDEK